MSFLTPYQESIKIPPEPNEIEVCIFGAGFGEGILIHVGNNEWIVVDSCRFSGINGPAALHYLQTLNIETTHAVKLIVATHWDDDHIRGISEIVKACGSAKIAMSAAINDKKFIKLVVDSPLSKAVSLRQRANTGISEFNQIFHHLKSQSKHIDYALNNKMLWKSESLNSTDIVSLSPNSQIFEKAIQSIISQIPQGNVPVGSIKAPKPNYTSVVLWVRAGEERILLGADLEESSHYKGWSILLEDKMFIDKKSNLYKVAHHGSKTGEHSGIWTDLLTENPLCIIAPWTLGGNLLPTPDDIQRTVSRTDNLYLAHQFSESTPSTSKEKHVKRALERIKAKPLLKEFGMVRLRKKFNETEWKSECFGSAIKVNI